MSTIPQLCVIFLLHTFSTPVFSLDLVIEEFKKCDTNASYVYDLKLTTRRNVIVDGIIKINALFGKIPIVFKVHMTTDGKRYFPVAEYKSNDACQKLNELGSQLWIDLQRAAKIMQPGSCPVPKGTYALKNVSVNFNKFGIQAFPKGSFKFIVDFPGTTNGIHNGCYIAIIHLL